MKILEISENRSIRDFLLTIQNIDFIYANGKQQTRNTIENQNIDLTDIELTVQLCQRTMNEKIENFCNYIKLNQITAAVKNSQTFFAIR